MSWCINICTYTYISLSVYQYIHVYIYTYMYIFICMYMYIYIFIYTCIHICIYIHVHVHIYINSCIYMNIYIYHIPIVIFCMNGQMCAYLHSYMIYNHAGLHEFIHTHTQKHTTGYFACTCPIIPGVPIGISKAFISKSSLPAPITIHTCGMTHSYVWHDSFICVTWCIHMCDMMHSHVCHDSFVCATWLIRMCDMTHSYVGHDSFIRATWHIQMCDMTHFNIHIQICHLSRHPWGYRVA